VQRVQGTSENLQKGSVVLEILSNTALDECVFAFFTEQRGSLFTKLIILLSCVADLTCEVSSIYLHFSKLFLS
jgi:hypothetical protein